MCKMLRISLATTQRGMLSAEAFPREKMFFRNKGLKGLITRIHRELKKLNSPKNQ
jgi:hypothetical protein